MASPSASTTGASTVRVTADRSRYAPGDTATVTVRTLDPSGRPVAASVFVQAVDEKLFAIGDAAVVDPHRRALCGRRQRHRRHDPVPPDPGR